MEGPGDSNSASEGEDTNLLPQYNYEKHVNSMAKMVSVLNLGFNTGESKSLLEIAQMANPYARTIPRNDIKREIYSIYEKEKISLIESPRAYSGRVSVCVDIWSDCHHWNYYLAVSCHYVDDDWILQKKVLGFRVYVKSCGVNEIHYQIKDIFDEFEIEDKVFTIGFDSVCIDPEIVPRMKDKCGWSYGGRFFHQRSACYVLDLCVEKGLGVLRSHIKPVSDALDYLSADFGAMYSWLKFCKAYKMPPVSLNQVDLSNWRFTYRLLSKSCEYKDVLVDFMNCNDTGVKLDREHLDVCRKICVFLQVFDSAYETLSSVYRPTTPSFMVEALNVVGILSEYEMDELLGPCVKLMKATWLDHFRNIPMIYIVALCFDPRCKLNGIMDFLTPYYNCLGIKDVDVVSVFNDAKNMFHELYEEYNKKYGTSVVQPEENEPKGLGSKLISDQMKKLWKLSSTSASVAEVDVYLETTFEYSEDEEFDLQVWWRDHEKSFPVLAVIAKQILGTPVSSMIVDQEYGPKNNTLDPRRSDMTDPSLVEVLVCVGDWIRAQRRQQGIDRTSEDAYEYVEEEEENGEDEYEEEEDEDEEDEDEEDRRRRRRRW